MNIEDMKGDVADIIVQCGDCHWRGPQKMLMQADSLADSLAYCPKCGREFNTFPLPSSQNTRAQR